MRDKRLVQASDVIFTVAIVVVAMVVWFALLSGDAGATVVIRQNGTVVAQLPLMKNAEFEVVGEYTNLFEIKDGSVRVSHTNCPNHQCEKMGSISREGASIVCAPNYVSATIIGEGEAVDAITG